MWRNTFNGISNYAGDTTWNLKIGIQSALRTVCVLGIHNVHLYICIDLLCAVGETSYRIWVGFKGSDEVHNTFLFIYLFIRI
jgi:hypothetical protein